MSEPKKSIESLYSSYLPKIEIDRAIQNYKLIGIFLINKVYFIKKTLSWIIIDQNVAMTIPEKKNKFLNENI